MGVSRFILCSTLASLVVCSACRTRPDEKWFVEGGYMDRELGEVTFDSDDFGKFDVKDVHQERLSFRFGVRSRTFGWHMQFFREEFLDEELDGGGLGFGLQGFAPFTGEAGGPRFGFAWGTDLALAVVTEDLLDIGYLEVDLFAGLGVDFQGFRPTVGVVLSRMVGVYDDLFDEGTISATNLGPVVGLEFITDDVPVFARARVGFGDVEGVLVGVGIRF